MLYKINKINLKWEFERIFDIFVTEMQEALYPMLSYIKQKFQEWYSRIRMYIYILYQYLGLIKQAMRLPCQKIQYLRMQSLIDQPSAVCT